MSNNASQLLRVLGSGVRPVSSASPAQAPAQGIEHASFDQLLSAARRTITANPSETALSSGREVSVADEAGLTLTPELSDRLSLAADRAEAAGIRSAIVLLDAGAYTLDVPSRTITGKALSEGGKGIHANIDGLVDLRTLTGDAEAAAVLSTAALKLNNASLLDMLTQSDQSQRQAG